MNFTGQLGQLTELWCQLHFCEWGINLSQPINPASRYDFLADINGTILRIQCKTAHPETNNRISITTASRNWNNGQRKSYVGQIDYFYTCWNQIGYLIPIELLTEQNRQKIIRLGNPTDYKTHPLNTIYGKDYTFDKIITKYDWSIEHFMTIETADRKEAQETDVKKNKCKDCGKLIYGNDYCAECFRKHQHPIDMPTREELKELIRTTPFTKIGKQYGRTDNAIRKWCEYYSLPRRKKDIDTYSDDDWLNV